MPSGGTWTTQNKVRPGAYINFKAVAKPQVLIGTRGIVACALPMTWGPEDSMISLLSTDLTDGSSLNKVGCDVSNVEESLPYRLLLSDCYKAILYKLNTGSVKSNAKLQTNLNVVAKYGGTTGNKLSVAVVEKNGNKYFNVLFNGIERESFLVTTFGDCKNIESDWVDASCDTQYDSTAIALSAGVSLTGGTNGTISIDRVTSFENLLLTNSWNCAVVQSTDATVPAKLASFCKDLRKNQGRKVQAVVYNDSSADDESIISTKGQGYNTEKETITPELFQLWVANVTAGAAVNESNTCKQIKDATSIINPIENKDVDKALEDGYFIITAMYDGTIMVEQDINTLKTLTEDKSYVFRKNRVIRCLDEIANTTYLLFNKQYAGNVSNTFDQRTSLKTQLISFMDTLQKMEAIKDFTSASDITINEGETIESVVVDLSVKPVDSMEKLYMTVYVNA